MLHPATSSRAVFLLLIPKDSILMSQAGHQVWHAVAIDILCVNECGASEIKFRMEYPLSIPGIRRRFKPALRRNDVGAPIAIYIARSDAMTVTLRADFVLDP